MTEEPHNPAEVPDHPETAAPAASTPATAKSPPQAMRLHPERPAVTRLSRKVIIGLGSAASIAIVAALGVALWPRHQIPKPEPVNTGAHNTPEVLANLPHDYSGLHKAPQLGPPLPGDLGKPILNAGTSAPGMPQPTPEQQRIAQAQDAARTSHLFATTNVSQPSAPPALPASVPGAPSIVQTSSDPTSTQNMQDAKLAFLNGPVDHQTVSPARIEKPVSPYVIQAGWIISGALSQGIKSDLPGDITALVTENIFDSPSGRYLLIPQGSKLFGKYSSQVSFGQTRVQVVWTRLTLPNGSWIALQNFPGADTQGYSGLQDDVDNHWGALFKAAVLSTVLSVGAEAGTSNSENNLAQAIRQGASQGISQTGQQIVERNLNIQPTLTDRFGLPVRIIVDRDIVLAPYPQEASR
jgi:type IV secretory pathway VirB10-like protein